MRYELRDDPPPRGEVYWEPNDLLSWRLDATPTALLLHAHPDDEVIFAAGMMLAFPEWRWELVCAVESNDGRAEGYRRSVELLRAQGVDARGTTLSCEDEWLTARDRRNWSRRVSQLDVRPDIVFTHGYRGEYGHPHHIALHHIAHTCFDNVWDFLHFPDRADEPQLVRGRVCEIPTDARKLRLLEEAYPEMVATLRAADPGLWRAQMTGLSEFFTS